MGKKNEKVPYNLNSIYSVQGDMLNLPHGEDNELQHNGLNGLREIFKKVAPGLGFEAELKHAR